MPNEQSGTGRKATRKPSAGEKSSASVRHAAPRALADSGGGGAIADPPIIVQGGGSIYLGVPRKFKEGGDDPRGRKKFRNADQELVSLIIDGGEPIPLRPDSTVEIIYATPPKPTPKGPDYKQGDY